MFHIDYKSQEINCIECASLLFGLKHLHSIKYFKLESIHGDSAKSYFFILVFLFQIGIRFQ